MKLWYLTTLTYPSTLANRLQVIKMAEAFSSHADITLWVESMSGKTKEVLASYGVGNHFDIKELPKSRGVLWPKSFFRALAFRSIVRRAPPETVFYTRDVLLAFFLSLLSPVFRGNFFFECHSLGKFPHVVYRRVFRTARGVVSSNKAKAEVMERTYGVAPGKILIAPNGFDANLFDNVPSSPEARAFLGLPLDKNIVLYAGSLQSWKGVDIIEKLAGRFPHLLFIVVGGEHEKKEGNFWVLPVVPSIRIPYYLRAADILIAPYRREGARTQLYFSPIKMMEYLASGTPAVVTDLASIREIADENFLWFAKSDGVQDFVDALGLVAARSQEAQEKALAGKTYIARFSWAKRGEKIVAFMRQCVGA